MICNAYVIIYNAHDFECLLLVSHAFQKGLISKRFLDSRKGAVRMAVPSISADVLQALQQKSDPFPVVFRHFYQVL